MYSYKPVGTYLKELQSAYTTNLQRYLRISIVYEIKDDHGYVFEHEIGNALNICIC